MSFKHIFKIRGLSIINKILVAFNQCGTVPEICSVVLWGFVGYPCKVIVKTCIHLCPSPALTSIRQNVVMMVTFLNRLFVFGSVLSEMRIRNPTYVNYQTLRDPNGLFVSCVTCDNIALSEIHFNLIVPSVESNHAINRLGLAN